jgi:8-oxo-dGTP diphosphatase
MERIPRIGMGILILREGRFLFMKRSTPHGKGTWCPPGGHLEFQESLEDCARREVREETGIEIKNIRLVAVTNDIHRNEDSHYITIHMLADHESGEPKIMEEDKATDMGWFEWNSLPQPLFLPIQNLLKQDFSPK